MLYHICLVMEYLNQNILLDIIVLINSMKIKITSFTASRDPITESEACASAFGIESSWNIISNSMVRYLCFFETGIF